MKLRLLLALGLALAAPLRARAEIDLDDERDPGSETWFDHRSGLGPALLECRVSAKSSLRCATTEALKAVECGELVSDAQNPLKVLVKGAAFACESLRANRSLQSSWRVVVTGVGGGVSVWDVEGRSASQTRRTYEAETKARPQSASFLDAYELGLGGYFTASSQSMNGEVGAALRIGRLRGAFRYAYPWTAPPGTLGADLEASLFYRVVGEPTRSRVEVGASYLRRARLDRSIEAPTLNAEGRLFVSDRWAVTIRGQARWPIFLAPESRQLDFMVGGGLELGPYFGGLLVRAGFDYDIERWNLATVIWDRAEPIVAGQLVWSRSF